MFGSELACNHYVCLLCSAQGSPPEDVQVEISSLSDISVMWSPPTGENAVLGYAVIYEADALLVEQTLATSTHLSNMVQGSLYTISVFAYDSFLPTPLSNQVQLLFSSELMS